MEIDIKTVPDNKILCSCIKVRMGDLKDAILHGSDTVDRVQMATHYGAICGNCTRKIDGIVKVLLDALEPEIKKRRRSFYRF